MDPNRERTFSAEDQTYTLVFGNRALRLIERELNRSLGTVLRDLMLIQTEQGLDLTRMNWSDVTVIVWAGLQQHHPNISLDAVDDVIDEAGGLVNIMEPLSGAVVAAFSPAGEDPSAGNGNRAPRRARVRTGTGTSTQN